MEAPKVPSPVMELHAERFEKHGVQVFVKREDLIHPHIMGNKWRKLKYNLLAARKGGFKTLKTFGGAFSNHIAATAAAANHFGLAAIGVIRGDELHVDSNPTLRFAASMGMKLEFVTRQDYTALKKMEGPQGDLFIIPEGGTNQLALKGVAELLDEVETDFDVLTVPIGTGGTMAGLIQALAGEKQVLGISSLKGNFILTELQGLLEKFEVPFHNYEILTDYHFGGYGRFDQELMRFIHIFRQDFGFLIDPVYTGKMFFGVFDKIAQGAFPQGTRIMLIHTGGLQGIDGFNFRYGTALQNA